ncbi:hypothetical protein [Streptomyces phage phiScoe15]|nr:hypothetical protein [Streptomyces phage phiScoe15]
MIGSMGGDATQEELDQLADEVEAFAHYIEDPECELEVILAIEEFYDVEV